MGLLRYTDPFTDLADVYLLTQHNIRFTKLVNNLLDVVSFPGHGSDLPESGFLLLKIWTRKSGLGHESHVIWRTEGANIRLRPGSPVTARVRSMN
jgi:hypothetical protein